MNSHPQYQPISINLESGWKDLFEGDSLARLENEALPTFLPGQRWFAR